MQDVQYFDDIVIDGNQLYAKDNNDGMLTPLSLDDGYSFATDKPDELDGKYCITLHRDNAYKLVYREIFENMELADQQASIFISKISQAQNGSFL